MPDLYSLLYLAGEPSFLSTEATRLLVSPIKVAAVVFLCFQHLRHVLRCFQKLCPHFSLLDGFGGMEHLRTDNKVDWTVN